jgi:hypothetical protein
VRVKFNDRESDVHTISPKQWLQAGVTHPAVVFNAANNFTAEVSDEAGQVLVNSDPNRWQDVTPDEESEAKAKHRQRSQG